MSKTQAKFLLAVSSFCLSAAPPDPLPQLTVRCYHYASLPSAVVVKAQVVAAERLRTAGISVEWLDFPIVDGRPVGKAGDDRPTEIILGLLPEQMARRIAAGPRQLGLALMNTESQLPVHAHIFVSRVEALATSAVLPFEVILGTAIAHEIGHLLLGTNSHSHKGIMRGQWRLSDLRDAREGALLFTPGQARRLRNGLLDRARAERKVQSIR